MQRTGGFLITFLAFVLLALPAAALPGGFSLHKFNPPDQQPRTENGVTTFHIENEHCSAVLYGDGRGESDCNNGNVRSVIVHQPMARMGEARSYAFDLRIDPGFAYAGFENPDSAGMLPDSWDSDLRIASWEGEFLHNFIYRVSVDATKGVTFLGYQCQAPEQFGEWVSFRMDVKWSGTDDGWIKVTCDDRVIYAAEALATNQAPHCWERNQCEPGIAKSPKTMLFVLGPVFQGNGADWQKAGRAGLFNTIQPEGTTIEMANMAVTANPVLYGDADKEVVRELQKTLNALGCDVGPEDGIAGKKTRAGALYCREFGKGVLPRDWSVATAPAFLAAYSGTGVADLPRGHEPLPPDYTIKATVTRQKTTGEDSNMDADVDGSVTWTSGKALPLHFIMAGEYSSVIKAVTSFELIFQTPLKASTEDKLKACRFVRIDRWGDGSRHLAVSAVRELGSGYAFPGAACVVDALPATFAEEARFVLARFGEIATAMADIGAIDLVKHVGLRQFLSDIATGEIALSAD